MNRIIVLVLVLATAAFINPVRSQNLCPNPGFEQLSGCPSGAGEINLSPPWTDAGSPTDLFSFCHVNGNPAGCNDVGVPVNFAGNSPAHGGSTYAGFYTKHPTVNQRSYLQAPLTAPLASGQLYKVSAFFKRSSLSEYATNRIGISFSTGPLSQTGGQYIAVTPQAELTSVVADTGNWTELKSYYTGTGLEDQLVIGNFRTDAATVAFNFTTAIPSCAAFTGSAFYYVDDVSVTVVNEQLSVTGDTLICSGESTTLTGMTNTEGWWSLQSTPTDTLASFNNAVTVTPAVTTTYLWNGIQSSYTVTVSVSPAAMVSLPPDTVICEGISFLLDAGNDSSTYAWSTGETTQQILVSDSGQYVVTVNNGYCFSRDTFLLEVLTSADVDLGGSATICTDNDESITLNAGPGFSYYWLPLDDTSAIAIITEPGVYSVQVTHANGCMKSDTIIVNDLCQETLFVPGAFTPNGDGKNDLFYAEGTNILKYQIRIFNRWGQPVFTTKILGPGGAWNGKDVDSKVPSGVYSYMIQYEALKTNGKIKKETKTGYFTLFR